MPTGLDILHELRNEQNFSSKYDQLDLTLEESPYPGNEHKKSDEIHTDRTKQCIFYKTDPGIYGNAGEKFSINGHKELEGYVKNSRLYYAVFHPKAYDEDRNLKPIDSRYTRYTFAVGVSPSTGNVIGVFAMQIDFQGISEEKHKEAPVEEEDHIDEGAIISNRRPDKLPDGSPRHMFHLKKDESVLSMNLMLWGGYKGIVSFEGTLSNEMKSSTGNEETDHDISFLLKYQIPEEIGLGVPVFRFLCVPEEPYLTRMPTGNDVIRDLGNEKNFLGRQIGLKGSEIPHVDGELDHSDELHTDRNNQFIFPQDGDDDYDIDVTGVPEELIERYVEARRKERAELKESYLQNVKAHKELEGFVKKGHLYYGVFHSKPHYDCGPRTSDSFYTFAVGVSPASGNLVGVFAMQGTRGLTC